MRITNPVLPGFHPDPSICRVGEDFYIATSSFEYFPGIPIYHSRNLRDWRLASYAITRSSQLNMLGNPPSGGIWAPCLSYSNGLFYMIYTDVKEWAGTRNDVAGGFKDTHNYLITTENIEGEWSDPIYLNSSGFDPSLFHDDDGRKWFVNMIWDYRAGRNSFAGIVLQEYDPRERRLTGPIQNIFQGTQRGVTEAPHLYKRNGWYYLMTAEGGTSYFHAVTLARSRNLLGNYEVHPNTHLLTAVANAEGLGKAFAEGRMDLVHTHLHPGLQKAGHASMVPWTEEEWVLAHLCGRPNNVGRCPLGRETAIQKIVWKADDWPYLVGTGASIEVEFSDRSENMGESDSAGRSASNSEPSADRSASPNGAETAPSLSLETSAGRSDGAETAPSANPNSAPYTWREDFDGAAWSPALNTLRCPADERYSLSERKGWLRLRGAESMVSRFKQSILVRRVQHPRWSAETCLDFSPTSFQQMAGLIIRYDETTQLLLRVSDTDGKRSLGIIHFDLNRMTMPVEECSLEQGPVYLAVDVRERELQLRWRQNAPSGGSPPNGASAQSTTPQQAQVAQSTSAQSPKQAQAATSAQEWKPIGPVFDPSIFSDDYVQPMGFTGSYVGIACFDLSGRSLHADFDYLSYEGKN